MWNITVKVSLKVSDHISMFELYPTYDAMSLQIKWLGISEYIAGALDIKMDVSLVDLFIS